MGVFRIHQLWTGVKAKDAKTGKYFFDEVHKDEEGVLCQDEYTGMLKVLSVDQHFYCGTRILAGEPPDKFPDRTIFFLRIQSSKDGQAPWKAAMTFRYRGRPEPLGGRRFRSDEDDLPPSDPDPNDDPTTYPDPDGDITDYDDSCPPDGDDDDDPPTGDGSDCDGIIGIAA